MTFSETADERLPTLSSREHRRLAEVLDRARGTQRTLEPLTRTYPELTLEDAGRVRDALVERRLSGGERLVGIASAGANGPFTWLTDRMLAPSGTVTVTGLQRPQVTPRYALWLGDGSDVLACLELFDQPFGEDLHATDGVAANGGTVRIVLGDTLTAHAARPHFEVDGRRLPLAANGERERLVSAAPALLASAGERLPARALVVSAPLAAPATLRAGSSARLAWTGGEAVWIEAT